DRIGRGLEHDIDTTPLPWQVRRHRGQDVSRYPVPKADVGGTGGNIVPFAGVEVGEPDDRAGRIVVDDGILPEANPGGETIMLPGHDINGLRLERMARKFLGEEAGGATPALGLRFHHLEASA